MNIEEFLTPRGQSTEGTSPNPPQEDTEFEEIDIQKAVVEELANEKVALNEKVNELNLQINELREQLKTAESECHTLSERCASLESSNQDACQQISDLQNKLSQLQNQQFDLQSRNPNALALLDRDVDIPDRFPGETRDHVLEVIREACDQAVKDGRLRRAQVLEGVLVANDSNGNLCLLRSELQKLFVDNNNIINGEVIKELDTRKIPYKDGETYLLASEILKRNY